MQSKRYLVLLFWSLFVLVLSGTIAYLMHGHTIALFDTKGLIATKERDLLIKTTALIATILIPVFAMTFFFAWRYREENKEATYSPEWAHGKYDELIWWAVPAEIILVLGTITFQSTHELDPYRPIEIEKVKPLKIQVVSLNWKWLFIYPEQHIATVNFLEIPEGTPIEFDITAESPMNSFWIPELGGQVYAMTGMKTKLHLIADETGVFRGLAANFTGDGFADMTFKTHAVKPEEFNSWVTEVANSNDVLDYNAYNMLAEHSTSSVKIFGDISEGMFDTILMKSMSTPNTHSGPSREHI